MNKIWAESSRLYNWSGHIGNETKLLTELSEKVVEKNISVVHGERRNETKCVDLFG